MDCNFYLCKYDLHVEKYHIEPYCKVSGLMHRYVHYTLRTFLFLAKHFLLQQI